MEREGYSTWTLGVIGGCVSDLVTRVLRGKLVSLEALQKRIDKCEDVNLCKIVDLNVNVKTAASKFWRVTPVKIDCLNVTSVKCIVMVGQPGISSISVSWGL